MSELTYQDNCNAITKAIQVLTSFKKSQAKHDYKLQSLNIILSQATEEELEAVCDALDIKKTKNVHYIEKELYKVGGHSVGNVMRLFTSSISEVDYEEVLDDIFKKLSITNAASNDGDREVQLIEFLGNQKLASLGDRKSVV